MIGPIKSRTFIVIELPRWDRSGGDPQYQAIPRLRRSQRGEPSKARRAAMESEAARRVRLLPGMSPMRRSGR